jgi:hypothetical protein
MISVSLLERHGLHRKQNIKGTQTDSKAISKASYIKGIHRQRDVQANGYTDKEEDDLTRFFYF